MDPTKGIQVDSLEEAHEAMHRLGWTDGLPAVPPTTKLVDAALDYLGRGRDEVIGEVPPKNRIATVEKVVINSVMAGCLPEYIPVVIAALEAMLDEAEGADILMVKPALPYLDIIARLRAETALPIAAYHVSGEYAMIKAAAQRGWLDERLCMTESLTAIARAGADVIFTYAALDYARWWRKSLM